jgi:hypothetical protein
MKRLAWFSIVFMVCISLAGCVYSSANVIRAQGKSILWLGAEGAIYVKDASINIVRSMDSKSHIPGGDYAHRPNIVEFTDSSNFSFGEPVSVPQPPQDNSPSPVITVPNGATAK